MEMKILEHDAEVSNYIYNLVEELITNIIQVIITVKLPTLEGSFNSRLVSTRRQLNIPHAALVSASLCI